jgi:predicted RNase H-like HicB family nuclease
MKLKILHLTVIIRKENPMYVSWCPELNIASQGKTIEDAIKNIREAIELYLEDEDAYIPEELYQSSSEEKPILTCLDVET